MPRNPPQKVSKGSLQTSQTQLACRTQNTQHARHCLTLQKTTERKKLLLEALQLPHVPTSTHAYVGSGSKFAMKFEFLGEIRSGTL